jgi:hypothetical protein
LTPSRNGSLSESEYARLPLAAVAAADAAGDGSASLQEAPLALRRR